MSRSDLTISAGRAVSRKSNRARTTAGSRVGNWVSSAALIAEENRSGVCISTSTMNVRPDNRSCARCRSRSTMAWRTLKTVLGRTPGRSLRTRSTRRLADSGLPGDLPDRIGM